jgi:hypothetical protein
LRLGSASQSPKKNSLFLMTAPPAVTPCRRKMIMSYLRKVEMSY